MKKEYKKIKYLYEFVMYLFSFHVMYFIIKTTLFVYPYDEMIGSLYIYIGMMIVLLFLYIFFGVNNLLELLPFLNLILMVPFVFSLLVERIFYLISGREKISMYFAVVFFFVFVYLLDIFFREMAKIKYIHLKFLGVILNLEDEYRIFVTFLNRCFVEIEGICNIVRVGLLFTQILSLSSYLVRDFNPERYSFVEAIVTSLAIEKTIKFYYSDLGKKQKVNIKTKFSLVKFNKTIL